MRSQLDGSRSYIQMRSAFLPQLVEEILDGSSTRCWTRRLSGLVRLEEGMNLAQRQRDSLLGFFPREQAHFGLGREHGALHGDGVGVRRDLVGQIRIGFWQLRTKSRVTVKTKSGLVSNKLVCARNVVPV